MDKPDLQDRLHRIRQRQYLILTLLVIPYLIGIAKVVGFWSVGVLSTVFVLVVFAVVAFSRRRSRTTTEQ